MAWTTAWTISRHLPRATRKLLLLCLHTSAAACIVAGGRIAERPRACGVRRRTAP